MKRSNDVAGLVVFPINCMSAVTSFCSCYSDPVCFNSEDLSLSKKSCNFQVGLVKYIRTESEVIVNKNTSFDRDGIHKSLILLNKIDGLADRAGRQDAETVSSRWKAINYAYEADY